MNKKTTKKIFWLIFIIVAIVISLGLLYYFGSPQSLTTVYSLQNENGTIAQPETPEQCNDLGGINIPIEQECPKDYNEIGNAGYYAICCLQNNCTGTWVRTYNAERHLFERKCQ